MKKCKFVKAPVRGITAVALQDVMPGELVFEEKEPLMLLSHSFCAKYETNFNSDLFFAWPAFNVFKNKLSPEKQRKFLGLYGPTTGASADSFRKIGRDRSLTAEELDLFVQVAQIAKLNVCGTESTGYKIFEISPQLLHSCDSNCICVLEGRTLACHARRFIKAGEVLTSGYVEQGDILPIHERRYKYLQMKEFTCHCRRCDAPGDDTRQFDCVDPRCKGVMMACEPVNERMAELLGTDMVYVEPHLLPCTVCHRPAPADYQTEMLALEKQLLSSYEHLQTMFENSFSKSEPQADEVLSKLLKLKFPRRHAGSLPLLTLEYKMKISMYLDCSIIMAPVAQEAFLQYLAALEHILGDMHRTTANHLHEFIRVFFKDSVSPIFSAQQEKELCQKALRMHLLLFGRDKRNEILENATARALRRLPAVPSQEVCAFCGESPQRAALTLSRCGQCRKGAYCCMNCHYAHWGTHLKTCKCCEDA